MRKTVSEQGTKIAQQKAYPQAVGAELRRSLWNFQLPGLYPDKDQGKCRVHLRNLWKGDSVAGAPVEGRVREF